MLSSALRKLEVTTPDALALILLQEVENKMEAVTRLSGNISDPPRDNTICGTSYITQFFARTLHTLPRYLCTTSFFSFLEMYLAAFASFWTFRRFRPEPKVVLNRPSWRVGAEYVHESITTTYVYALDRPSWEHR